MKIKDPRFDLNKIESTNDVAQYFEVLCSGQRIGYIQEWHPGIRTAPTYGYQFNPIHSRATTFVGVFPNIEDAVEALELEARSVYDALSFVVC